MERIQAVTLLSVLCLSAMSTEAVAFDGQRKGFALGVGFGTTVSFETSERLSYAATPSPPRNIAWVGNTDDYRQPYFSNVNNAAYGGTVNLSLGYGFDERNVLVAEVLVNGLYSRRNKLHTSESYGLTMMHYFGSSGNSLFASIGARILSVSRYDFSFVPNGYGLALGAGFELRPGLQLGANVVYGTITRFSSDQNHSQLNILLMRFVY